MHAPIAKPNSALQTEGNPDEDEQTGTGTKGDRGGTLKPKS